MAGVRFGRLTGVEYSHTVRGHAHWLFLCDCGERTTANGAAVRAGRTSSCGCMHREICAARLMVHGRRAAKNHDATYRAWQEINTYCYNPCSPRFGEFGARGVGVDQSWRDDFRTFLATMGERPAGTKLVRIDQRGHFAPDNCRWGRVSSRSVRARNGHDRHRGHANLAHEPISPQLP